MQAETTENHAVPVQNEEDDPSRQVHLRSFCVLIDLLFTTVSVITLLLFNTCTCPKDPSWCSPDGDQSFGLGEGTGEGGRETGDGEWFCPSQVDR